MDISVEKRRVYSEVYEFINLLDIEYIDKIPKKLIDFFDNERDKNYFKNINPWKSIMTQGLNKSTISIISVLNLKYWADAEEKNRLLNLYRNNEQKTHEKYSAEKLFRSEKENINSFEKAQSSIYLKETEKNNDKNQLIIIKDNDSFFVKLIKKIKKFFIKFK